MSSQKKFIWTFFGVLKDVYENNDCFCIENADGKICKMSKHKYKDMVDEIKKQIQDEDLKGKPVYYRTSQNTAEWDSEEWFSGIRLAEQRVNRLPRPQRHYASSASDCPACHGTGIAESSYDGDCPLCGTPYGTEPKNEW